MSSHPEFVGYRVGDFFEKDGFVAYYYERYTDISSENASFPEYGYVTELVVTDEKWEQHNKK